MENYETLRSFEMMVEQLSRTFRVTPEIIAHDLHPAYLEHSVCPAERRDNAQGGGAAPSRTHRCVHGRKRVGKRTGRNWRVV